MHRLLNRPLNLTLTFLSVVSVLMLGNNAKTPEGEWRFYGGDPGGQKFSPLKQINRTNVAQLKRAWTYHTGEVSPGQRSTMKNRLISFQSTPLMVDDVLYVSTPGNQVIALEAETGKEIWKFDTQSGKSDKREVRAHRGVAFWKETTSDRKGEESRILFGTYDGRLIAVDAATGKPCLGFGKGGTLNLKEGVADKYLADEYAVTSPAAVYKDLVIIGAGLPESPPRGPSGDVRAFDVRTGKLVWQFHTIPRPGEAGSETWEGDSWKDRTGVNVWSIMSVDAERGMIFLPIGSASYDFYGGDRKGQNLYANCLVALEAATGKFLWHYQMVHHDLWDYDLPAQPNLITVRRNGKDVPAAAGARLAGRWDAQLSSEVELTRAKRSRLCRKAQSAPGHS